MRPQPLAVCWGPLRGRLLTVLTRRAARRSPGRYLARLAKGHRGPLVNSPAPLRRRHDDRGPSRATPAECLCNCSRSVPALLSAMNAAQSAPARTSAFVRRARHRSASGAATNQRRSSGAGSTIRKRRAIGEGRDAHSSRFAALLRSCRGPRGCRPGDSGGRHQNATAQSRSGVGGRRVRSAIQRGEMKMRLLGI
jgi:hypothetical protein